MTVTKKSGARTKTVAPGGKFYAQPRVVQEIVRLPYEVLINISTLGNTLNVYCDDQPPLVMQGQTSILASGRVIKIEATGNMVMGGFAVVSLPAPPKVV